MKVVVANGILGRVAMVEKDRSDVVSVTLCHSLTNDIVENIQKNRNIFFLIMKVMEGLFSGGLVFLFIILCYGYNWSYHCIRRQW